MPSPTPSDPDRAARRVAVFARPDESEAQDFVAASESTDFEADLHETGSSDELEREVHRAIDRGVDVVAAVGGDGSLNLVADALASAGSMIPVVPVRAGTVNLMTQVLALESIDAAVEAVRAGRVRSMDLGRTDAGHFVMNASTGYDAAVIGDAADHSDARFGRLRFLAAGLQRLRRDAPKQVSVAVDGAELHRGRAMSVIVFNVGRRVSDSFEVAPDASIEDGLLDVAVVRVSTVTRMVAMVGQLALGRNVPSHDVVRAQGTRIEVEWETTVASQRDGDVDDPVRSLVAEVAPQALRIHHGPDHSI